MNASGPYKFEEVRPLGSGGMGDVFLARSFDSEGEQWLAIKRVHPGLLQQPGVRERFEREAEICGLLRHPNIVSLRAHGVDGNGPFLAFEFVQGASAASLVQWSRASGRQLPLRAVLILARDCAAALGHAHQRTRADGVAAPVIHRDVSPDNVLVSEGGVAKLSDFGISRVLGRTTIGSGSIKGKIGYLAPELFRGEEPGTAADVFSFCVSVFELLCGVLPFHGKHDAELISSVLHAHAPELRRLRADLPEDVAAWLQAGLSKSASERPKDFSVLIAALDAWFGEDVDAARAELAACVRESGVASVRSDEVAHSGPGGRTVAWSADRGERRTARRRIVVAAATVFFAAGGVIAALALRAPTLEPDAAAQPSGVAPVATPSVTPPPSSLASDAASAIVPPPPTAPRETISTSAPSTESPARKRGDRASRRRPSAATSTQRKATGPPAKQSGYLRLRVHPWAEVFVDGKRRGVTPLPLIELSPGVHSVILVNADLGVREAHQVRIGAGREALLKTVLTPPPIR